MLGEECDWHTGLVSFKLFLYVWGTVDIDEGVVVALISEVARSILINFIEDFSEFVVNIRHVMLVRVDDVIGFFNDLKELGQLGDYVLVEWLLDLIKIVSFGNQNAYRVYIFLSLVSLVRIFILT